MGHITETTGPRTRSTKRVALSLNTKGGANQADAKAADINVIVAQYKKNGTLPMVARSNPLYGDFTFPEDLHLMREAVHQAEDRFDDLPADVRTAAQNDWVRFLQMFDDPDEQKILEQAGLQLTDNPIPNNSPPPEETPPPVTSTTTSVPPDPEVTPPPPEDPRS